MTRTDDVVAAGDLETARQLGKHGYPLMVPLACVLDRLHSAATTMWQITLGVTTGTTIGKETRR